MCDLNYENSFIEVFACCGGIIKAGFKPLLLVDNVKDCIKTLKLNHSKSQILNQDVTIYLQ